MKATIFGTGYVGLVTGACLAEMGNHVICVDIDEAKVERLKRGEIPIYEPGLEPIVKRNHASGQLDFTTDPAPAIAHGQVIFIAVGTPPDEDGSADLRYVLGVARTIGRHLDRYAVVVRAGHPRTLAAKVRTSIHELQRLEYVAVRSHSETLRILQQLHLDSRLVLTSAHFLALPAIIARTELAVVMPRDIARGFVDADRYALLPVELPRSSFTVSLHWSSRFESDPAHRWMRKLFVSLFADKARGAG